MKHQYPRCWRRRERADSEPMSAPSWLAGARMAPSAHNTQPWLFTPLSDGRVAVRWDAARRLPVADPTSRDLYLSLGAAIESACLHALVDRAPLRFEAASEEAPSHEFERTVGWLALDDAATEPDPADLALAAMLDQRQTARGPHRSSPIPAPVCESLIAEAARHGARLQIATARPAVHTLAKLAGQATALLFADDGVHRELWQWLRLDPYAPAYYRDGLTADCLELSGASLWLARQLMQPARMRSASRFGLHYAIASDTWKVARESAAICLLSAPASDRPTLVGIGRTLQRLWLLAASSGLATHPLSALLDRSETAGRTVALFDSSAGVERPQPSPLPEGEGVCSLWARARVRAEPARTGVRTPGASREPGVFPAAIFRLGYSAPAARSPRLPLDELWQTDNT